MDSKFFLLLSMAISCGNIISARPLQADTIHENVPNETNLGAVTPTKSSVSTTSNRRTDSLEITTTITNTNKNTEATLKNTNTNTETPLKKRFRRSYGYRTQCIPVEKTKCQVFRVNNIEKNFCVMYTEYICTALDWTIAPRCWSIHKNFVQSWAPVFPDITFSRPDTSADGQ